MDIEEFRQDLEATIKNSNFNLGTGIQAEFAKDVTQMMQDAEYLNGDFHEAFFKGVHPKRRSNMRVDGYARDEVNNGLILFIVDYVQDDTNMTKTLAESNFKMLAAFVDAAISTNLDVEESSSIADLVEILRATAGKTSRYTFILLTNAKRSVTLVEIKDIDVVGKSVDCQVWDIERIFEVYSSMQVREPIKIDFSEYGGGIPCLLADNAISDSYESFLCVMPGKILADIYDLYGSRLLEGNVRSFLSTKRSVNKKIRASILNEPEMFFALNNGIAATAKDLTVESCAGFSLITSAVDFQIINGGQTTASLSNARFRDKTNLENIFVQMKLTKIGDMDNDAQDKLIEKISRASNSQNKVSDSDFFATHAFHVEMEKISKRIFAPPVGGLQYQTKWFYERARGQYLQEQMRMTRAQRKNFQRQIPKSQVMTKTDFAKYQMTWAGYPDIVSKGAQTNFMKFAIAITNEWTKDKLQFNERYFKETVALAIFWKTIEKIVSSQSWYKNSYRANIVTYSLALFHHIMKKIFPNEKFDLMSIWNNQAVPELVQNFFVELTKFVNDFITREDRLVLNVTQWCKQEECWKRLVKESASIVIPPELKDFMKDKNAVKSEKKDARAVQKIDADIQAQSEVVKFNGQTWWKISNDAHQQNLIATEAERLALKAAMKIPLKIPQDFQCTLLLKILERLKENGYTYTPSEF